MNQQGVIRFEPYGPAGEGLAEWYVIDPSGPDAGNPYSTCTFIMSTRRPVT